jgi:outer membrane biosynthesis protein TonB
MTTTIAASRRYARWLAGGALVTALVAALLLAPLVHADEPLDELGVPVQAEVVVQDEPTPTPTPTDTPIPPPTETPLPPPTETPAPPPTDTPLPEPSPTETPSPDPSPTATATASLTPEITVEAQAQKELELTVSSQGAAFGQVSPEATVVGGHPRLQASQVSGGADYVIPSVVTLRVKSDTDWTIACSIADTGSTGGASISALSWRVSGSGEWQAFPSGTVILSGEAGTTKIDLDFRLHVSWDTQPGALNALVTYQAAATAVEEG